MMKKIDIILATFLFSFIGVLLGCIKESSKNGGDMPVPTDKAYNVSFSLSVGVETYSIPAQDYRKTFLTFKYYSLIVRIISWRYQMYYLSIH